MANDQDSNQWNRIENLCDKSSNVINSPEMLESLVSSELHHTYDDIRTKDDNIEAIVKTPEEHVLSNISSLLQYLPEQVEKLVVECDEGTELSSILDEPILGGRNSANVAEIEKVFNETFIPASDHDFVPITSPGDCYPNEGQYKDNDLKNGNQNDPNARGVFFAHRQTVPDPEEDVSYPVGNESPLKPPNYYSDDSDESLPNSVDSSCRIKSNDEMPIQNNFSTIHPNPETSREKDKLRIKELESEIRVLQDCLELAEAHVDKVETDLAKEKSRNILISKDLSALEKVSAYKVERLQADLQISRARADGAEKKCYENHLMHQDALEMLRVSLTEAYESQVKEKDGDLNVLRREMLEAVTKFNGEKQHWEHVFLQKEQDLQHEKDSNEIEIQSLKSQLEAMEKKAKQRGKEIKRLRRDYSQVSNKTTLNDSGIVSTEVLPTNTSERAYRIARILDVIDSID